MELRRQAIGMLVGLSVQYLIGIAANLFVSFPDDAAQKQLWEFAKSQPLIILHILIGLGLLFGAISLLIRSKKQKNQSWVKSSILGLIFILIAILSGSTFISSQKDLYSYLMAVAFLGAFLSYCWGIYKSRV